MKALLAAVTLSAVVSASAVAQTPPGLPSQDAILEMVARMVIDKYKTSSCEDLRANKSAPPAEIMAQGIEFMKNNPAARVKFINMIAAPVANRMFECGMIP